MSKIALGTVQFGLDYGVSSTSGQTPFESVGSILHYAQSKNINLLDTAPAYGNSEQVLGETGIQRFEVVTKTRHFESDKIDNNDANLIKKDFSSSLLRLKTDSIYGILVHNANDLLKPGSERLFNQLVDLKQEKKVEKIGVSIYNHNQLKSILDNFDIDLVQLPFNILDTRLIDNGMFTTLQDKGIEIHARSIFLQGLLLMPERSRPDKFKRWGALWKTWHEWLVDNQITALEATIRHAISMSEIFKVIVGVDTQDQLEEIVSASCGKLPDIPHDLFTDDDNLLNPSNWETL